jgi:hypothetical protein
MGTPQLAGRGRSMRAGRHLATEDEVPRYERPRPSYATRPPPLHQPNPALYSPHGPQPTVTPSRPRKASQAWSIRKIAASVVSPSSSGARGMYRMNPFTASGYPKSA